HHSCLSCSRRPSLFHFFFLSIRPPPSSTLFPYTTLFRSDDRLRFWEEVRAIHMVEAAGDLAREFQVRGLVLADRNSVRAVDENRSEEHTSELQSLTNIVCRLLL